MSYCTASLYLVILCWDTISLRLAFSLSDYSASLLYTDMADVA